MDKLIINIDGGARGNPGPAALGVSFSDKSGNQFVSYSKYLGEKTNNEAEYLALIFALKKAKARFGKEKIKRASVEVRSDSELLVKQMRGEYKIKEKNIQSLFIEAWNLRVELGAVSFVSVPREENKIADKLVNEELDRNNKSRKLF